MTLSPYHPSTTHHIFLHTCAFVCSVRANSPWNTRKIHTTLQPSDSVDESTASHVGSSGWDSFGPTHLCYCSSIKARDSRLNSCPIQPLRGNEGHASKALTGPVSRATYTGRAVHVDQSHDRLLTFTMQALAQHCAANSDALVGQRCSPDAREGRKGAQGREFLLSPPVSWAEHHCHLQSYYHYHHHRRRHHPQRNLQRPSWRWVRSLAHHRPQPLMPLQPPVCAGC